MATLLPTAFFASLDRGTGSQLEEGGVSLVSDFTRGEILKISRGIAIILIVLAFNFIGDGLRDVFEVRLRRR